ASPSVVAFLSSRLRSKRGPILRAPPIIAAIPLRATRDPTRFAPERCAALRGVLARARADRIAAALAAARHDARDARRRRRRRARALVLRVERRGHEVADGLRSRARGAARAHRV